MEDQPADKKWRPTPLKPVEVEFVDPSLSADALIARRAIISLQLSDIDDSLSSIRTQISSAEDAEARLGIYRNPEWARRVHAAAKHFDRQRNEHLRALENLSRRIAYLEQAEECRERAFVAVAERMLTVALVRELWARVDAGDDRGFVGVANAAVGDQANV
jgi:hypothetical protein